MAINNNEGPKLQDINALMHQMAAGSQSSGGDDSNKNQFETIADGLATHLTRLLGKLSFGLIKIRLRTLGSTGLFKQFTPAQEWSGKLVNEAAPTASGKGGVLANTAQKIGLTRPDFGSIAKPPIEGFPVQSMSYASLGNLTPMDTGGSSGRGGIGLA
ncbi:MAG: hypothetical protein ABL867_01895 [Rickettsiales bacterium]